MKGNEMLSYELAEKLADRKERIAELAERIANYDDDAIISLFDDANRYSGGFEFVEHFDIADIEEHTYGVDKYDLLCMIVCGNVTNVTGIVRWNGYGNLETTSIYEIARMCRDEAEYMAAWLIDDYNNVRDSIEEEELELLEMWEYVDINGYDED